ARELMDILADGNLYRLPTEAEWEYSCRGGAHASKAFGVGGGTSLSSTQANFNGNYPFGGAGLGEFLAATARVGSYPANSLGLHDMHGNVWEWCWDLYGLYPPGCVSNPTGPERGEGRVVRGGSWNNDGGSCRSAFRLGSTPGFRTNFLGFRLARSLPSEGG